MRNYSTRAHQATNLDSLRGLEGSAAQTYFAAVASTLEPEWQFSTRNYRPATDPINTLLSFGYALLLRKIISALHLTGLHPAIGFLHVSHGQRPALALDLMEEYRAVLIDQLVFTLVVNRRLNPQDFSSDKGGTVLSEPAKAYFVRTFETRLQDTITLANTSYRYEQLFLAQARSLSKFFRGEVASYHALKVR